MLKFDGIKVQKTECKLIVSSPSVRTVLQQNFSEDEPYLPTPESPFSQVCECVCELRAKSCIYRVLHAPLYIGVEVGPAGALLCE